MTRNKVPLNHRQNSSAPAQNQASVAQAPAEHVEKSWLASLTPEERAEEEKEQGRRQKKAEEIKKQQLLDQQRRASEERAQKQAQLREAQKDKAWEQEKLRAQEQGVLEAHEWPDGQWYVEVSKGVWKEMGHKFYCIHCDAGMNDAAVSSHIKGERHRKRLAAKGYEATTNVTLPPKSSAAAWLAAASPPTYWAPCSGPQPAAVDSNGDGERIHEDGYVYIPPEEEWLAWVCDPDFDAKGLYLKCLLCNKWITDLPGTDPRGYDGLHGRLSSKNQKDHKRKLENLPHYKQDHTFWNSMLAERTKWHVPSKIVIDTSPLDKVEALESGQSRPKLPSVAALELPAGWFAGWCTEQEQYYYWSELHESQWELPTVPASGVAGGA